LAQALLKVIRASPSRMFYGMQQMSRPEPQFRHRVVACG
jgi:hypothetical protein